MEDLDLEKIVEFMNSEPEKEVDSNEIENTLEYIDTQLATVKEQTKDITTPAQTEIQQHTINELTDIALKQLGKVDKNTDEIYNLFYGPLAMRQDRSDASKVALVESQRLKIEMVNALAGLASAQAKLEQAKAKVAGGPAGIYVQAQNGSEVGIDLHSLWESTKS